MIQWSSTNTKEFFSKSGCLKKAGLISMGLGPGLVLTVRSGGEGTGPVCMQSTRTREGRPTGSARRKAPVGPFALHSKLNWVKTNNSKITFGPVGSFVEPVTSCGCLSCLGIGVRLLITPHTTHHTPHTDHKTTHTRAEPLRKIELVSHGLGLGLGLAMGGRHLA